MTGLSVGIPNYSRVAVTEKEFPAGGIFRTK
jgi:hypothetical protein